VFTVLSLLKVSSRCWRMLTASLIFPLSGSPGVRCTYCWKW